MPDAGGDFADGVIAADGLPLGGERLLTFDRRASSRSIDPSTFSPDARPVKPWPAARICARQAAKEKRP